MRVAVFVKATSDSEMGIMPTAQALADMDRFNHELQAAGVLRMGEGLRPTRDALRVAFDGTSRTVSSGPFAPPAALVAGFWL